MCWYVVNVHHSDVAIEICRAKIGGIGILRLSDLGADLALMMFDSSYSKNNIGIFSRGSCKHVLCNQTFLHLQKSQLPHANAN